MTHQDEEFQVSKMQFIDQRQRTEDAILLHIQELQKGQKELTAKMNYHHAVFREEVERSVNNVFERAFPDGEPEKHREYHELLIKQAENKAKFWNEMVLAGAKWAGLGVLGFLGTAVWIAIKTKVAQ